MNFSQEYQNLEERVELAFTKLREQHKLIEFFKITPEMEANDEWQDELSECPSTYYNHKHSGAEKHIYLIKIDSEGIHAIDSDDNTKQVCIGLNDLNGLFYKIELLELIEKHLDKNKLNYSIIQNVFSSWEGELETIIEGIAKHENQNDLIDYLDLDFQVCEAFEFTFTCKEFLEFIK